MHRTRTLARFVSLAAVAAAVLAAGGGARADHGAQVGFGVRRITPVTRAGETDWPPAAWRQFFTPHQTTGVWGEPYDDRDGNGCFSGLNNHNMEPILDLEPPRGENPEPHTDQIWNSAGDGVLAGAFGVDGVTIYGDPQSAGKWDGVWANAGFGSRCTLGAQDDTWARAIVIEAGGKTVAMVSLDVVGLFNIEVRRARRELRVRYPQMPIDELVVSSTHTHEGVDTMGFWGQLYLSIDGKFPTYQAFIRSQIVDAVHDAWLSRQHARMRFARTVHTVGVRDSRPPHIIDPYLYAAEFVADDDTTIGTLVNWSNHPEAQASGNPYVSSDFPHGARAQLEADLGGTAIYFSGSVGGLMTPLGVDIPGYGSDVSWERTYEVGRLVARAAEAALDGTDAAAIRSDLIEITTLDVERREFYMTVDNALLRALNVEGIFDIPTYTGGESWGREVERRPGVYMHYDGSDLQTEMVAVRFGPALFLSVPGELSPELEIGWPDPSNPRPDCPEANTGRPLEPPIATSFEHPFQFILGLGQDELGYVIPGYDFWVTSVPEAQGRGVIPVGGLEAEDPCGEGHYEETVSGGSTFAPWVTCVARELGGRDPWETEPACAYDNMHGMLPYGVHRP